MFNSFSGSFTVYNSAGITLPAALAVSKDELKGYRVAITVSTTIIEYTITGNTTTSILFSNSIAGAGTYAISFVTRGLLDDFESDMALTTKVSNTLLADKIENVKRFFTEKLKLQFRFLYDEFPDDIDPLSRIINLGEIQIAFCYYLISEIYADLLLTEGDINQFKCKQYMSKYKELIDGALARLSYLREGVTELENIDLGTSKNQGVLMSR
jgi:hypothetical protein